MGVPDGQSGVRGCKYYPKALAGTIEGMLLTFFSLSVGLVWLPHPCTLGVCEDCLVSLRLASWLGVLEEGQSF